MIFSAQDFKMIAYLIMKRRFPHSQRGQKHMVTTGFDKNTVYFIGISLDAMLFLFIMTSVLEGFLDVAKGSIRKPKLFFGEGK